MQRVYAPIGSAIRAAEYYGFTPFDSLGIKPIVPTAAEIANDPKKILKPQKITPQIKSKQSRDFLSEVQTIRSDEKSLLSAMKVFGKYAHIANKTAKFLWRKGPGADVDDTVNLELHILGVPTGMAEAILISLAHSVAHDAGVTEHVVRINSYGAAESSGRYVRDIGVFLRKHIEEIPGILRPRAAVDPLGTLLKLIEKGSPIISTAPQAMEYLNEEERKHLWDVLEYLEARELYYELSGHVIGSRDCWSHTLFEISQIDREAGVALSFARGGRYDTLATNFGLPVEHAVMLSLVCSPKGRIPTAAKQRTRPGLYFAHLGNEARRKSLSVLELLRTADIPVQQSLTFEQMGDQMRVAKDMRAPYLIIMGHKEAMEGTVLVRDTYTNMQEAIPVPELPQYLRRNKMVKA